MKIPVVALVVSSLMIGCAAISAVKPPTLLVQADDQLAGDNYRRALELYGEFLRTNAEHPAAPRARGARAVLEKLIAAQAEIERVKPELERLQRDAGTRDAEQRRLRAEVARLQADLERLRNIDLRPEPRR